MHEVILTEMLRVFSDSLSPEFRLDHLAAGAWLAGEELAWLEGSGPDEVADGAIVAFGAPRAVIETTSENPFPKLERMLSEKCSSAADSRIQGGAIGYIGYECCRFIENIETGPHRMFDLPDCRFAFPEQWVERRERREPRIYCMVDGDARAAARALEKARTDALRLEMLGSHRAAAREPRVARVETIWSRDRYLLSAGWIREQIAAGEIYQGNLTQPFYAGDTDDPFSVYLRLLKDNPSPFSAFLGFGNYAIASSSPELLLRKRGLRAQTRPIKGTRARTGDAAGDARAIADLDTSEKERAELNMIIDLERNDLSRVCEPGSVVVAEARRIESYSTVHHAVGIVEGNLRANATTIDILNAIFPGGSITGCPKIRAMQLLREIEREPRGMNFGSIGWIGGNGDLDLNIAIRTLTFARSGDAAQPRWNCSFRTGGGIVADSDPRAEYVESLAKTRALARALLDNEFEKCYRSELELLSRLNNGQTEN